MRIAEFIMQIEQQRKEQDSLYHAMAVHYGLSDTAMWVLYYVSGATGDCTQQELCRQGFFPKQTINTTINKLVKNGFAELIPIPGTRNQKKIKLTDAGVQLAQGTTAHMQEAEQKAYGRLTPEELHLYLSVTTRLTDYLREETENLVRKKK